MGDCLFYNKQSKQKADTPEHVTFAIQYIFTLLRMCHLNMQTELKFNDIQNASKCNKCKSQTNLVPAMYVPIMYVKSKCSSEKITSKMPLEKLLFDTLEQAFKRSHRCVAG